MWIVPSAVFFFSQDLCRFTECGTEKGKWRENTVRFKCDHMRTCQQRVKNALFKYESHVKQFDLDALKAMRNIKS